MEIQKVGLPVVRELLGAMTAESAAQGIVIATSSFTSDARAFARKHRIEPIEGTQLVQAIARVKNNKSSYDL
ncbi:MAG: restriction endonuclease [Verrucomicrobiota bacterium]